MADDKSSTDTPAPPEPKRRERFQWPSREAILTLLARGIIPLAAAFLTFLLVSQTETSLSKIDGLIQLAIALIAGVAVYTVITDIRVEGLPEKLSNDLASIERKLQPVDQHLSQLADQLDHLSDAIDHQFQRLADQHGMEMLFDQSQALEKARELQDRAENRVEAMWTFLPYDDVLKAYFDEMLGKDQPFTNRIVAARNVPFSNLVDHIDKTWDRLADHSYEIHLVYDCNFEVVIVDRETAALFIYSDHGYSCCYMSSPQRKFVDAVEGLAAGLRRPEWRLPVKKGAKKKKELAKVQDWLHTYYAAML